MRAGSLAPAVPGRSRQAVRLAALAAAAVAVLVLAAYGLGLAYLQAVRRVAFAADPAAAQAAPAFERLLASPAMRTTEALVVVRDGRLLYERYRRELDLVPEQLKRRDIASAAKGVTGGTALALLAQEGLLGLDDPLGPYVPAWREDPVRSRLTLRQLATHSAGLRSAARDDELAWGRTYIREPQKRVALAMETPFVGEPGRAVAYSNPAFTLLGYAMGRALADAGREDLKAFLRARLWRPLDVPDGAWEIGYGAPVRHEGVDAYEIGGGTRLTARALARLGAALAAGGVWESERVLEPGWLGTLAAPTTAALPADWRERRQPAAALGWWVNANGAWPEAPPDTMVAAGFDHRLLVVIPSLDLAVARFGRRLGEDGFHGDYWQAFEAGLLNPLLATIRVLPPG